MTLGKSVDFRTLSDVHSYSPPPTPSDGPRVLLRLPVEEQAATSGAPGPAAYGTRSGGWVLRGFPEVRAGGPVWTVAPDTCPQLTAPPPSRRAAGP